ncbi:MAG: acyltransferase [Lachnospiraceae bacterium]|nr:acyltransferase [Lachnospiraceae bacterium]
MQQSLASDSRKRLIGLDILKGVCALFVVFIHFPFLGISGKIITVIARGAVPVFFMCSGYFLKKSDECNFLVFTRKVKHIGKITIASVMLYIIYTAYCSGIGYVISEINIVNLAKVLIFNAPQISSWHLWFLFALLYAYTLYYMMCKLNLQRYKLGIAVVGLAVNLIIREFLYAIGIDILAQFVRNAYCFGLPFFIIGTWIRDSKHRVQEIQTSKCWRMVIVGLCIAILENQLWGDYTLELSFGIILYAVFLFVLAVKYKGRDFFILEYIGRNCSLYIYVIHVIVGTMVFRLGEVQESYWWIATLLTIIISVGISIMFSVGLNKVTSRKKGLR